MLFFLLLITLIFTLTSLLTITYPGTLPIYPDTLLFSTVINDFLTCLSFCCYLSTNITSFLSFYLFVRFFRCLISLRFLLLVPRTTYHRYLIHHFMSQFHISQKRKALEFERYISIKMNDHFNYYNDVLRGSI